MTQYRAVTRIKRPPPRSPDKVKWEGIFGEVEAAYVVSDVMETSSGLFRRREDDLRARWMVVAEGERERAKGNDFREQPKSKKEAKTRGPNIRPSNTSRVYDVLKRGGKMTPREIADVLGDVKRKQVSDSLRNLKHQNRAEIVSKVHDGRGCKTHWQIIEEGAE